MFVSVTGGRKVVAGDRIKDGKYISRSKNYLYGFIVFCAVIIILAWNKGGGGW